MLARRNLADRVKAVSPRLSVRIGLLLALLFALFALVIGVADRLNIFSVWDDAYMFVRYADNLIHHHSWSWNPGGEPTYGLTSNLYMLIVLPVRLLIPNNPAAAVLSSSLLSTLIFILILVTLIGKYVECGPLLKRLIILFVICALTNVAARLSKHMVSGMDTMFDMAWIAFYLLVAKWSNSKPRFSSAVVAGFVGGLTYSTRPDLMLYTCLVPLTILIANRQPSARRHAILVFALTVGVAAAQVLFSLEYFHTLLPLPFYAKGLRHYDTAIYGHYRFIPIRELITYLTCYWPFCLVIAADLTLNWRAWLKRESAFDTGLLVATLLYLGYYSMLVLQVMYYEARFYYPTLPALCYLASRSAADLVRLVTPLCRLESTRHRRWALTGLTFLILGPTFLPTLTNVFWARSNWNVGDYEHFFDWSDHATQVHRYWFQLASISALPDDLTLAATEVGHLGAYNPRKTIVDLASLNNTQFAHHGFSADRLFACHHPDFIYMPHWHYDRIVTDILANPTFVADYDYYPAKKINAELGIAISRKSKYYHAMRDIVEDGIKYPPIIREPPRKEPPG